MQPRPEIQLKFRCIFVIHIILLKLANSILTRRTTMSAASGVLGKKDHSPILILHVVCLKTCYHFTMFLHPFGTMSSPSVGATEKTTSSTLLSTFVGRAQAHLKSLVKFSQSLFPRHDVNYDQSLLIFSDEWS